MARIDALIDVLIDKRIPMAAMQPNQPVMLDKGGGDSEPLNKRELSARQIELLLSELLSAEQKAELRTAGRIELDYTNAEEPVTVTALHRAGKLSVYFSLETSGAAGDQSDATSMSQSVESSESGTGSPSILGAGDAIEPESDEPAAEAADESADATASEPSKTEGDEPARPPTDRAISPDGERSGKRDNEEPDSAESASSDGKARSPDPTPANEANDAPTDAAAVDASSSLTADPRENEADLDELAASFDDDSHESSFVDASARPTSADQQRGKQVAEPDEREIPMKQPGTSAAIDRYLQVMAEQGCSDLHLTSGNPPLYRQDGEITHLDDMESLSPNEVEELLLPIIPDRNYEEFLEIRDTDFSYEIQGVGRFRCNIFMDRVGPGGVFRLIPDELMTAEDLDLSDEILELCSLNKGFVLVTGPTGSGKSTTLAALIDYINRERTSHIITVEDPIEFVHENKNCLINQREVGVHTMDFTNAIRAALREDPDIVLVGELRDLETIELALEMAETGHLVFGTLHTNTAPSTIDRIIDQFPTDRQAQIRTMLSESLRAVIAQTLCKKIDGGRIAAMEVLMVNNAVSNMIREGKTYQIPNVMETSSGDGMVKLNEALMEHVDNGVISPDEAYFNAVDKDEIRGRLKRAGHHVDAE